MSEAAPVPKSSPSPVSSTTCVPPCIRWRSRRRPCPRSTSPHMEWSGCIPMSRWPIPSTAGEPGLLERSVTDTAAGLGSDAISYRKLFAPLVEGYGALVDSVLSPLSMPSPRAAGLLARFAAAGVLPADASGPFTFRRRRGTGAVGRTGRTLDALAALACHRGLRAVPRHARSCGGLAAGTGGSQTIADALSAIIVESGGEIVLDRFVHSLDELPPAPATLLDVSPRQLLGLAGDRLSPRYRRALRRYRYGAAVWKVDWALDGPIPWTSDGVRKAATVHVGGTLNEVAASEAEVAAGRNPESPFVLVVQPTIVDPTRAPAGSHVAWAVLPRSERVDVRHDGSNREAGREVRPRFPGSGHRSSRDESGRHRAPRRELRRRRHRGRLYRPEATRDTSGHFAAVRGAHRSTVSICARRPRRPDRVSTECAVGMRHSARRPIGAELRFRHAFCNVTMDELLSLAALGSQGGTPQPAMSGGGPWTLRWKNGSVATCA